MRDGSRPGSAEGVSREKLPIPGVAPLIVEQGQRGQGAHVVTSMDAQDHDAKILVIKRWFA